jgi:hypothetical protein
VKRLLLLLIVVAATYGLLVENAHAQNICDKRQPTQGCWSPPPPPPPPPPAPPPPPPPPAPVYACSDGWDNDGDGRSDLYDYGCANNPYDNNESDNEVYKSVGFWGEPSYACGTAQASNGIFYTEQAFANVFCLASTSRCKKQQYTDTVTQAGLYNVSQYLAEYVVCYRYNAGIVSVMSRTGKSIHSAGGWNFGGNAANYPQHLRYAKYVDFYYVYKLDFGALGQTVATKWPYVTLRFNDTNTQSVIQDGIG